MASKDLFDGQMSMFAMDDEMGFDTIGMTGGADEFYEEEAPAVKTAEKEPVIAAEAEAVEVQTSAPVRKPSLPKLKIEGVFPCMGCGKLLTKTITGEKFKATCNTCNVTYSGNN